ncbi:MAG: DNA polymerase III, partial [Candidatus Staskawiczbacteria bacterium]|nr:DNA polymerase III [Candidatus Staskawiczbacteria bacterium]
MNEKISKIFNDMANLLEIKGETSFRINAYKKAAKLLESLKEDVFTIYKEKGTKGIKKIEGVGESIAKKIEEYI